VIATTPMRLGSLLLLAFVVLAAAKGISSGVATGGGLLDGDSLGRGAGGTGSPAAADAGSRTSAVVADVLDGDTVTVTTAKGQEYSVRLLGIGAPEIQHPGKAGECYGHHSTIHLEELLPVGTDVVSSLIRGRPTPTSTTAGFATSRLPAATSAAPRSSPGWPRPVRALTRWHVTGPT
jgi:endonuclease YncB( thermonuclease family)